MAGFRNKSFLFTRNEVDPSLELHRMLFPFIESLIGDPGTVKNTDCRRDCDKEMNQFDPNNTKEVETILPEPLIPLPESDNTRRPTVYRVRSNITFVLRLMLRFRRVLLQDAAVLLFLGIFKSKKFLSIKMDVVAALLMERIELPKDIPDNMLRALEVSSSNHSGGMQELRKVPIAFNDNLTQQSNQGL
ncbi:hypothetical protein BGX24_000571 [Mortierella sp. AD032]|nr:hypothetical protein BGX24_000571 [Mortierella sp. AD032]